MLNVSGVYVGMRVVCMLVCEWRVCWSVSSVCVRVSGVYVGVSVESMLVCVYVFVCGVYVRVSVVCTMV